MREQVKPQLKIKPKFNFLCMFIDKHLLTILAVIILLSITYKAELLKVYILIIALYLLYVLLTLVIYNRKCKKTSYLFFYDRLIIKEKSKENEILYEDIKDFLIYQSTVQKLFNYGEISIKLKDDNILSKGIPMIALPNIDKVAKQIKQVVYGE